MRQSPVIYVGDRSHRCAGSGEDGVVDVVESLARCCTCFKSYMFVEVLVVTPQIDERGKGDRRKYKA